MAQNSLSVLFKQTLLYGLSSVVGRFLNYLLTPVLTAVLSTQANGEMATIYALLAFLNIFFSFGMETTYFRYANKQEEKKVFNTAFSFLVLMIGCGVACLLLTVNWSTNFLQLTGKEHLLYYMIGILCLDNLAVLPLSRLRYENKALRFALIRIIAILINVGLVLFFLLLCPYLQKHYPDTFFLTLGQSDAILEYVFIANILASLFTLLALLPSFKTFVFSLDKKLLPMLLRYALPLIVVGITGMVNETLDRIMLPKFLDGTTEYKYIQNGIYSVNYKLSILITLFIQAFRMGSEPFFFRKAKDTDAKIVYARIMNFFVIVCLSGFLLVVLFLDVWKYFINAQVNKDFASGLRVVPILLLANVFLGMYYNISIWYKLTNRTKIGAYMAVFGAALTITGNALFIPKYGYMACAWVTFLCYFSMLLMSYFWGRKYYPVPYPLWRIGFYFALALSIFVGIKYLALPTSAIRIVVGGIGLLLFLSMVGLKEKNVLKSLFKNK